MFQVNEFLKDCSVQNNIVKLPEVQLDRNDYLEVKKKLELIGGKWKGGKTQGFVFEQDPSELLGKVSEGNNVNLKKEFQFFETPESIADELVRLAGVGEFQYCNILEPSAGRGAIVKAINKILPNKVVDCCELMNLNRTVLEENPNVKLVANDFLTYKPDYKYHQIIANPPFSKNQDIEHIYKMYELLMPKGRIVSVASKHWQLSSNKKETQFRHWLENSRANIIEIESGAFRDSGTMVSSCIIVIDKP